MLSYIVPQDFGGVFMGDIALILVMLAGVGFGWWAMKRLDRFLETHVRDSEDDEANSGQRPQ